MNFIDLNKDFLFIGNDEECIRTFYKSCLQHIKLQKIILLLTASTNDLLPILKEAKLTETELKRFVIIPLENMDTCIEKLNEQHDWAWLPSLIIVDLRGILVKLSTTTETAMQANTTNLDNTELSPKPKSFFQQLSLCVATLLCFHQAIIKRLKKRSSTSSTDIETVSSVLILNEDAVHLKSSQLDLLINLYYYKNNAFDVVQELVDKIAIKN